jgi:hypothetical protein
LNSCEGDGREGTGKRQEFCALSHDLNSGSGLATARHTAVHSSLNTVEVKNTSTHPNYFMVFTGTHLALLIIVVLDDVFPTSQTEE